MKTILTKLPPFDPKQFLMDQTAKYKVKDRPIEIFGAEHGSCSICDNETATNSVEYQRYNEGLRMHFKAFLCDSCMSDPDWIEWMSENEIIETKKYHGQE